METGRRMDVFLYGWTGVQWRKVSFHFSSNLAHKDWNAHNPSLFKKTVWEWEDEEEEYNIKWNNDNYSDHYRKEISVCSIANVEENMIQNIQDLGQP